MAVTKHVFQIVNRNDLLSYLTDALALPSKQWLIPDHSGLYSTPDNGFAGTSNPNPATDPSGQYYDTVLWDNDSRDPVGVHIEFGVAEEDMNTVFDNLPSPTGSGWELHVRHLEHRGSGGRYYDLIFYDFA